MTILEDDSDNEIMHYGIKRKSGRYHTPGAAVKQNTPGVDPSKTWSPLSRLKACLRKTWHQRWVSSLRTTKKVNQLNSL